MPDTATEQVGVIQTWRETPRAARLALLGAFVNQFGAFVQLFLVLYLTHRGFSKAQTAFGLGSYAVGAIGGTLFGGTVSDRLGPHRTIVTAMCGTAVFTASVTVLTNYPTILVAVTLSGVMTQAARPAISAMLLGLVPKQRQTMMFAMYTTAVNAGSIGGPLLAAWLSTISWNLVFWFDAGTSFAYGLIAYFFLRPSDAAKPEPETAKARGGFRTLLRDRRYLAYLSLMLANGLVHIQFYAVLPLLLAARHYPTWVYASVVATAVTIVVGANMVVTTRTQTWPPWVAVITGWLLLVVGRGGYGLPGGLAIIFVATMIGSIGVVIGGPAAFAYPAKVAPPGALGRYIGSAQAVFQSGYAIGPIVGVLLWSRLGSGFFAIVVAFGVVMTLPGLWGMRPAATTPVEPVISQSTDPVSEPA